MGDAIQPAPPLVIGVDHVPRGPGGDAYKRIIVYIGTPEKYADVEKIILEKSRYRSMTQKHIVVVELCRELGWTHPEVA